MQLPHRAQRFLPELCWKLWLDAFCSWKPHSAAFVPPSAVLHRQPLRGDEKGSVPSAGANASIYCGTRGLNTTYLLFSECLSILSSPACSWVSCPRRLKKDLIFHCDAVCNLFLQVDSFCFSFYSPERLFVTVTLLWPQFQLV